MSCVLMLVLVAAQTPLVAPTTLDLDSVDVAVFDFRCPRFRTDTASTLAPAAAIMNLGYGSCRTNAFCRIESAGVAVYSAADSNGILGAGESLVVQFDTWPKPHAPGNYVVQCSVYSAGDSRTWNNVLRHAFHIEPVHPAHFPPMWRTRAPMPTAPSGKSETDGGWLVYNAAGQRLYAAKGGKKGDFYSYDPVRDSWHSLAPIPLGRENKPPGKGAVAACDGQRYVYAVKGNGTLGFYRYDIQNDSWRQLTDVPLGVYESKVKSASDMLYLKRVGRDSGCVYLLKGKNADIYRYWPVDDSWQALGYIPMVNDPLTYEGSWIAAHAIPNIDYYRIYAHKGRWHTFWWFDAWADTWQRSEWPTMPGMPLENHQGKSKVSKKGGCAVWHNEGIFALKGNNTQDFWRFTAPCTWAEYDTVPQVGTSGKKKRVKGGADIAAAGGWIYALKGGKTNELWLYDWEMQSPSPEVPNAPAATGVVPAAQVSLSVAPNPLTADRLTVQYAIPTARPATLALADVAGRIRMSVPLPGRRGVVSLDLSRFSTGLYFVVAQAGDFRAVQRAVLLR